MGIIKAAISAIGGSLADQWQEIVKADNMDDTTVMSMGVTVRPKDKRNQNTKGTVGTISNGSVIMVEQNQFMLLSDGGKIIDYSAEPGYYTVNNSSSPSLFNGEFEKTLEDTFNRFRFGGVAPRAQSAVFINTQEIKNIPFGTVNPINYFDNFYNAELYLRCHGYFSIRITDPLKFFAEAIPRNAVRVDIKDMQNLYLAEFLTALQTSIGKMSVDGIRISYIPSKSTELARYLSDVLDDEWTSRRGIIIESVGIASISYDESSKKLIDIRNQGAMLSDASIREGYVQGSVARGIESAGSNSSGAAGAFMGVGMGMNAGGNFMAGASASNQAQMERNAAQSGNAGAWKCSCGAECKGNFCQVCGKPKPSGEWICGKCGASSTGNFCQQCGAKAPVNKCPHCGVALSSPAKFCPECGREIG